MFKQFMSDFAFNRNIDKTRKVSKSGKQNNSAVIASLLETQALKYYSGNKAKVIDNLLIECVNRLKTDLKQTVDHANDDNLSFDIVCISCSTAHAVLENDISNELRKSINVENQIKILVNLKLLPERFLTLEFEEEGVA